MTDFGELMRQGHELESASLGGCRCEVHHVGVNIDELRWFLVLAETQNVTRAAELLNITQPTLSRALHRLERQVGAPLFTRSKQRVHLNRNGEIFRAHAQRAVQEIAHAEDSIATLLRPAPGTVRLGFLHSLGTWLVPDLVGGFRTVDPQIRFVLQQNSADQVLAALRDDRADLILTSPQPPDPLVDWLALKNEPLVLAVPPSHPLAARKAVRLNDVAEEKFLAMHTEFGLRQTTDSMFRRRGITASVVLESAEVATIRGLVANGMGVAIVPGGHHVPRSPDLAIVTLLDEDAYRTLGLAWNSGRSLSPAARRFRHYTATRSDDIRNGRVVTDDPPDAMGPGNERAIEPPAAVR